jgi:hypothetical protein
MEGRVRKGMEWVGTRREKGRVSESTVLDTVERWHGPYVS